MEETMTAREGESATAFTIRLVMAEALKRAKARIEAMEPDESAIAPEHKVGVRAGFRTARGEALNILDELIWE